jgi:hypothetical protein
MERELYGIPAPPFPEGFPPKIMVYGWFKRNGDWHPREVDELYLDELEWIPIYEQAVDEAVEYVRKQNEFRNK